MDIVFDADGDEVWELSETVTVDVDASASDVQAALRALGGFLEDAEVSLDTGIQRARNGGEAEGGTAAAFRSASMSQEKKAASLSRTFLC